MAGLSRKLEVAARLGWPWDAVTTPFVSRAGDRLASPHDLLMVRGDWPELPPFCAGQLASH